MGLFADGLGLLDGEVHSMDGMSGTYIDTLAAELALLEINI